MATITFRTDPAVDAALRELTADGTDRSRVIRESILAAQCRVHARRLRAEAEAVAADLEDRAEARAIMSDMEALRAG